MEVYAHPSNRFLTVTGAHWPGTATSITEQQTALDWLHDKYMTTGGQDKPPPVDKPSPDLDDAALLVKARSARNGAEFERLFGGDLSGHQGDHSAADLALCSLLAFWTDRDATRIDRLFRSSGLMRPKWDEKRGEATYAHLTIRKAIAGAKETYRGKVRPAEKAAEAGSSPGPNGDIPTDSLDGWNPGEPPAQGPGMVQGTTAPKVAPWPEPSPLPHRGGSGAAEYPLDRLPSAIREAAVEIARFTKVPIASPAAVGVAVTALAIGKKALVEERRGLRHHPALFLALIAASGERKSPVFQAMTAALERWIAAQMPGYEQARHETQANNEVIEARIAGLKAQAKKPGTDLEATKRDVRLLLARVQREPAHPRMFTSDTTEQRLFQKLEQHGGAYAVLSGEGRPVFDAIMGKYSGEGRTGDAIYLAGISGDTITRDRVGNEHGPEEKAIVRPCLNVCVMVQPDKYLEAAAHPSLRASGALARIWPVWLPSLVGYRLESSAEADLDNSRLAAYDALILKLLSAPLKTDDHGHSLAHVVTLSAEARAARREFHNVIETMMCHGRDLADVRDIASKAVTQTAKLALVLHIAADSDRLRADNSVIDVNTWLDAQAIGTYHLTEAVRVQRLADEDTSLDMARRVLAWISQGRLAEVSSTAIMQYSPRPRPNAKQAGIVLDILIEHGFLRPRTDEAKRRPVYEVHPQLARLATLASMEAVNAN